MYGELTPYLIVKRKPNEVLLSPIRTLSQNEKKILQFFFAILDLVLMEWKFWA